MALAVLMLTLVSIGAVAQVKVVFGEKGEEKFPGKGGTITVSQETKGDEVTVTLTVTPDKGYTITKGDIKVYATYPPSGTRTPEIANNLTLYYNGSEKEDVKDLSAKRDYTFTIGSNFGAWVKEANFSSGSKGPQRGGITITALSDITDAGGHYTINQDISGGTPGVTTFNGTLEAAINSETHMPYRISGLSAPLFETLTGTVKNLVLEGVSISSGDDDGNTGAIACTANGDARIYNVGILSGSVGGTGNTGGIVGLLEGTARVINCYSYADITGGTNVGGIVGNNSVTTTASSIKTMVMNCMFYGDITGGTTISPVFGGTNIANLQGGLNSFNYYAYDELKTKAISDNKYNSALAVEEKYLNRFEFYRLLLNSNKKLAAFYVTGSVDNGSQMLKWVLETADRTIDAPKPYPILKAQGYYPSIINPDAANAPDSVTVGRNHGGKLPSPRNTLTVTISSEQTTGGQTKPDGASITTQSLTLVRTDKDFDRFNYNYDKVQLPYYNDVGTGNYTGNRVVTGWKITAITAVTDDPYTSANYPTTGIKDFPDHNYADRKSSNKDLYSVSKRVFSQGAYFDVPYGVTSITIEPYWGKAYYLADQYYDVVYSANYNTKQGVSQTGTQVNTSTTLFNGQNVETSIERALNNINNNMGGWGPTVYDNALVLVGNLHLNTVPQNGTTPFTMMSVDEDNDHEPDYSLIYHHTGRSSITPIRYDFLNIPGTAQAQKPNGASLICNFTIFKTRGWFEVTNTALFYTSQLEYENLDNNTKTDAPLILLGGVVDQFVSTQSKAVTGKTIYIHVGGNVWIKEFGMGTHSDGSESTPHVPVSVTGGEFPGFYLTGTYKADAKVRTDNAECYISGGYIHEAAGASLEQIDGDVHWQIYNADIDEFFGGGINDAKPIKGNIITDIYNSNVTLFCGGPKFGNMQTGKTVTTNAEGCTFGKYFGAGYGGTSLAKKKYYDKDGSQNWTTLQGYYTTDRGKYFNGSSTGSSQTSGKDYGKKGPGVATDFDYEFFVWTSGTTGARLYVKFAAFSLAQCNDVSSTLKKCTVNENFYGGGNLGKVVGTATSVLEDCTVKGSVYGAGYSASLPTVEVRDGGFTQNPNFNQQSGMFEPGIFSGTTTFTWKNAAEAGVTLKDKESGSDLTNHILYTNTELTGLGEVAKAVLTINGTTTVAESVYGGGEESGVGGDTEVTVNGGFIGAEGGTSYGYRYGNVYGGGKGKIDNEGNLVVSSIADLDAGLVKGNTSVTINGTKETTKIVHNVYGGGAVGSVGTFTRDANGMPTACAANTGQAKVTINGGKIGHNRKDSGMVDGSSRGWEGNAQAEGSFLNQLAWVNNAIVIIGAESSEDPEDKGPVILGSVYGGGENGHNFNDSNVTVNKGTIGNADSSADGYECGNVYGAGCGTDTYTVGDDPTEHYNPMAGIVRGNATVTIKGGHVLRNVYGAGSMGSVGNEADAEGASTSGKTTVKITGDAQIGADSHGNIYGAARGDLAVQEENLANVRETEVEISGDADIKGSVFGGGEAGIVWENVKVNILGGAIAKDVYGGGALANTQIANSNQGNTTSTFTTLVNLKGGTISGDAYGGGLGRKEVKNESDEVTTTGIAALVKGDVKVELNKDIAITGVRGCVVNQIFGCNNQNGTPEGNVEVHVYNTQRAGATQIVNYANVTNAKVAGTQDSNGDFDLNSFDVAAVYGGGNQADYIPVDGTNQKTYVVIEGCDRTSIGNVYGGGNAAAVPGTHVLIKGSYEIGEVFGGGNGAKEGTRAHVGKYNESEEDYILGDGKALVQLMAGKVKFVYGGSNTRGNIRGGATVNNVDNEWTEGTQADCCENMQVGQIFAGGKNADMASGADVVLGCTNSNDWVEEIYAGARRANVGGDVSLTITSGKFGRVFGGNMISGKLNGSITVNIDENGVCGIPVIIGELYGGGNLAPYSIYGYNDDGTVKTSGDNPHASPVVNVRAFTSIGNIFGGGYGNSAVMVGSPTVNINEAAINHTDEDATYEGNQFSGTNLYFVNSVLDLSKTSDPTDMTNVYKVVVPDHTDGKMGAIGNIYGGGNAAEVQGDTHVNIGTDTEVYVVRPDLTVTDKVKGFYTRSWNSATKTYDYTLIEDADKTAEEGVNYYQKRDVAGADIRGNVYGGGNNAEVTGNTNVVIGKRSE
jgi:hypothetical protein